MRGSLASGIAALVVLGSAPAHAGTPFGGDDGGFVPPSAAVKRCEEDVLSRTLRRHASCVLKCHVKAAKEGLGGNPSDDETCELTCAMKYDLKAQKTLARGGCPSCLDLPAQQALAAQTESFLDTGNAMVFCAPGTPFGGDDGGSVPADLPTLKCEQTVAKNLKAILRCIRSCHFKAGRRAFRGQPYDEEACEQGCGTKYDGVRDRLLAKPGCPSCLDAAGQDAIGDDAETFADDLNGAIYCASPGGAFID